MERTVRSLFLISSLILVDSYMLLYFPDSTTPTSCKIVQWLHEFPQESHFLVHPSDSLLPNASQGVYIAETTTLSGMFTPEANFISTLQYWQNFGVRGVIMLDTYRDPGYLTLSEASGYKFPPNLTIPIGIISASCCNPGTFPNGINVTVVGYDHNGWLSFLYSPWYYFWYISLIFFFLINICYSIQKLVKGWPLYQNGITISFICLCLELIGNFLRVMLMIFDPYLNTFNLPNAKVLQTMSLPFSLSSSILLIFFWLDLTSGSLYQGRLLSVMKIPTMITIGVIFSIEIILDTIKIVTGANTAAFVLGLYALIHTATAIFYFYAASKIVKMRQDFSKDKANHLYKITIQVVLCGVAILGTTLAILIFFLQNLWASPAGTFSTQYLLWFSLFPQSFLQIMVFGNHRSKTTSSPNPDNVE